MKKFLRILFAVTVLAGGLYGAWTALEYFDNVRVAYREELARSQLLNQANQQRISELMAENIRLRAELERVVPVFADDSPLGRGGGNADGVVNNEIISTPDHPAPTEALASSEGNLEDNELEENEDVRRETDTE